MPDAIDWTAYRDIYYSPYQFRAWILEDHIGELVAQIDDYDLAFAIRALQQAAKNDSQSKSQTTAAKA